VQPIPTPRTCAEVLRDGGSLPRTVTLYVDGQPNLPFDALCGIDGGMYLPPALAGPGFDGHPPAPPASAAPDLTERQVDVLRLVAEGKANKEIAQALGLAPATVKIHLAAAYRALGVANRTQAALAAERLGLRRSGG
jgi:DNA-binding NarL/FixJ family response regulator